MKVHIVAVGKLKKGPERELSTMFVDRIIQTGRPVGITGVTVSELPESTASSAGKRKEDEANRLLASLPAGCELVALDENGQNLTSRKLAGKIGQLAQEGTSDLAFAIGGPDGHGADVLAQARFSLSFGKATWPHRLVRIMLAEQIYRSVTIMVNHPYHRD